MCCRSVCIVNITLIRKPLSQLPFSIQITRHRSERLRPHVLLRANKEILTDLTPWFLHYVMLPAMCLSERNLVTLGTNWGSFPTLHADMTAIRAYEWGHKGWRWTDALLPEFRVVNEYPPVEDMMAATSVDVCRHQFYLLEEEPDEWLGFIPEEVQNWEAPPLVQPQPVVPDPDPLAEILRHNQELMNAVDQVVEAQEESDIGLLSYEAIFEGPNGLWAVAAESKNCEIPDRRELRVTTGISFDSTNEVYVIPFHPDTAFQHHVPAAQDQNEDLPFCLPMLHQVDRMWELYPHTEWRHVGFREGAEWLRSGMVIRLQLLPVRAATHVGHFSQRYHVLLSLRSQSDLWDSTCPESLRLGAPYEAWSKYYRGQAWMGFPTFIVERQAQTEEAHISLINIEPPTCRSYCVDQVERNGFCLCVLCRWPRLTVPELLAASEWNRFRCWLLTHEHSEVPYTVNNAYQPVTVARSYTPALVEDDTHTRNRKERAAHPEWYEDAPVQPWRSVEAIEDDHIGATGYYEDTDDEPSVSQGPQLPFSAIETFEMIYSTPDEVDPLREVSMGDSQTYDSS